jgi:hypothetical protein
MLDGESTNVRGHDLDRIACRAASSTSTPCARADVSQSASSGVDPHR